MADPMDIPDPTRRPNPTQAGIITKLRLENFMCHSNLEIDLGDSLNFITGQNGSGKSAILTALCVAFGSRAKGTQRANTMKDFIKNGCSYALVHVEIKNQGDDAFKAETFGDIIIVERRISESASSTVLKNKQGKKVAGRKEDLNELLDHFNIDVENPCVVMSQDKSREFLHSGNAKDKFKFFFKATLLHRLDCLLNDIENQLNAATELVDQLEKSLRPVLKELEELQGKIKSMEHVEEITQQVQLLKKKLAWSWVYDVDKRLKEKKKLIAKLKGRIPACQARIDEQNHKVEELRDQFSTKKNDISSIFNKASEAKRKKGDLQQSLSLAMREKMQLEGERGRKINHIQKMLEQAKLLEQQIQEIQEQHTKDTQAEEIQMEENLKELQSEVDKANLIYQRLKEEEDDISESWNSARDEIKSITSQIEDIERRHRDIRSQIRELQLHSSNKVTVFGGQKVTSLLQAIERHHQRFRRPPIGPIGAHVTLAQGEIWAVAIENAIGKLLNAFIVSDHKDSLLLRACAREANYNHLQIIIYDFSRPRLHIPAHMLPQTNNATAISVVHSDNPTVLNVLIDIGGAERLVLVKDYDAGKQVAFDQRVPNLKEVYTSDGYKMFSRGSGQTILPPNKNARTGRLCGSFDNQIKSLEREIISVQERAQEGRGIKRTKEEALGSLNDKLQIAKRRRIDTERMLRSKVFKLEDMKKLMAVEANSVSSSTVDELHQEISNVQEEIHEKEILLEDLQIRLNEAKAKEDNLRASFEDLCDLAKEDIDALEKAESELMMIEKDLHAAETEKKHFESVMSTKVLSDIKAAETNYHELEKERKENSRKASIICLESEIDALGENNEAGPEQLSAQLSTLNRRLERESQRFSESIDELRMQYENKERKISRKQQNYIALREKLDACKKALELRWSKFRRNAVELRRQLTWRFNGHLKNKGISGHIKVNYDEQTLSIEVTMPHDASSSSVRDTRGLSGGERSFSTLCFALALHQMIEAPFRAMDEFDVFMDAVSRKISLDAIVDFAIEQGSQWIFITPHDISMVKQDERIKKQQMAAPRA